MKRLLIGVMTLMCAAYSGVSQITVQSAVGPTDGPEWLLGCCNNAGRTFCLYEARNTECDPLYVGRASMRGDNSCEDVYLLNRYKNSRGVRPGYSTMATIDRRYSKVDYGAYKGEESYKNQCDEKDRIQWRRETFPPGIENTSPGSCNPKTLVNAIPQKGDREGPARALTILYRSRRRLLSQREPRKRRRGVE